MLSFATIRHKDKKNWISTSRSCPPKVSYRNWRRSFEPFMKLKLSLARTLSSDTSLELAALIPNFARILSLLFFRI